jgi:putative ABC transport system permease protein
MRDAGVPRLWRALLRACARPEDRRFVVDDLEEEFVERHDRAGRRAAGRWYRSQVLRSVTPLLRQRLGGPRVADAGRRSASRVADASGRSASRVATVRSRASLPADVRADVRFALRQLRRSPVFTAVAILTLGVGIGAATAIFNAAEVALRRPLPFEHEDRLVRIYQVPEAGRPWISLRPATYQAVARAGRFFDAIVAQRYTSFVHATEAGPERVIGIGVTAGWAEALGVRAQRGRVFTAEEERLGSAAGVVVLSHGAWQRRYGGSDAVLGRELQLEGRAHEIVGVMPRGFQYPYNAELWVPLRAEDAQVGPWSFNVQARLRPGVSLAAARAELAVITREAAASGEAPALADGLTLIAVPLRETLVGEEGRTSLVLLGAVGFLLLIVCANLANLFLAKGFARERELAVRASLGASRGRLVRQLLTESIVLGGLGSIAGVTLAHLGSGVAQPLLPGDFEYWDAAVTMNRAVLGFAVGVGLVTTLLFGLFPALRLARATSGSQLLHARGMSMSAAGRRVGRSLVVGEIALGLVLLSGAALVLQDLRRLASVDLGYEPDRLLTASVPLSREPYTEPAARIDVITRVAAGLAARPDILAAGATTIFPSDGGNALAQVRIEGVEERPGSPRMVNHRLVSPGFLDALGVSVVKGRGLSVSDRAGATPVALISTAMAQRFWPGQDPIGRRITRPGVDDEWLTVVGVVGDVKEFVDVTETWYLPFAQHADEVSASNVTFAVRGTDDVPSAAAVRTILADIAPDLPLADVITARALHAESFGRQRQAAALSAAFAGFGLLLATMGVFGSISWTVTSRRREFAIRMALGSDRSDVLRNVLSEGARMVATGATIGVLGALMVGRLLAGALETVEGFDPLGVAVALLAIVSASLVASLQPARRAAAADPAEVLREE